MSKAVVLHNDAQRAAYIVCGLTFGLIGVGYMVSESGVPAAIVGVCLVAVGVGMFWFGLRLGTTIERSGITVRSFGTRHVPWSSVDQFDVRTDGSLLGWTYLEARLHDGARVNLHGSAVASAQGRDELAAVVDDLDRLRTLYGVQEQPPEGPSSTAR